MNRLVDVTPFANANAIRTLGREDIPVAKTIHVLSVGSMDRGSVVHDTLLDEASFHLSIATDYRELWGMPTQESIHVAILHNTLSSFELEAAGRLIRRRWPQARILVVSSGESYLEDALYDDRVAPTAAPEVLLTTIDQLLGGWHEWRPGDVVM
ncbi:MAG: hypothetical protein ACLPM3_10255 [Terracidiphilus sp.]